jgi:hypothetical protein
MPYGIGIQSAHMHLNQLGIELDKLSPAQEACMMEMEMILPNMSDMMPMTV